MYLSYYGLEKNLFQKEINANEAFKSNSFTNAIARLQYLKETRGIGLFTGGPGLGKTYALRCFADEINTDLYKIIYISATKLTKFEFLNCLCKNLGLDVGNCYTNEIEENIQKAIKKLWKEQKKRVILILDNVENMQSEIILELKILYDFDMESMDYVSIALVGNNVIREELKKVKYESFQQRIIVKYDFENLSRKEVEEYIKTRLELSGQSKNIFTDNAIYALYMVSKGNVRKLNVLIINCLIIGSQQQKELIDEEIVRLAKEQNKL